MEAAIPAAPSVRYLNPAWFASVMGTGVLALALAQFGLVGLALPVYGLALLFMAGLLGLYLAKLLRYPQAALADLQHPLLSQMLPTLPIALLVLSLATRALPLGPWAQPLGQGLFLLGTPLIFLVGLLVVYWVSTRLKLPIEAASGAWFIPPVSALLVPMAGGLWLSSFPKAWQKELWVVSGLFLGIGLFLFLFVLPSFLQRLYGYGRLEPHRPVQHDQLDRREGAARNAAQPACIHNQVAQQIGLGAGLERRQGLDQGIGAELGVPLPAQRAPWQPQAQVDARKLVKLELPQPRKPAQVLELLLARNPLVPHRHLHHQGR